MTIPAHLAGGYLAIKLIDNINPSIGLGSDGVLMIGLIGSVIPDIDFFFSKYIRDHHSTIPHAPLFWLSMYSIVYLISLFLNNQVIISFSVAFIIGITVHLFLDWFNARTAGIRIFYPISSKMFSLFPLKPDKGKIPTALFPFPTKQYTEFIKFYSKNTFLLFTEIAITVVGFLVWALNKLKYICDIEEE